MSTPVVFLVNPASAGGSTGSRWPEIARRAAELGIEGDALLSEGPGQLSALARDAAAAGARLLVAVGGDGTVNEVVNGLATGDTDAELAVIPRGTGADFVRTFGIPGKLDDALLVAREGRTRTIDLGRATYRTWSGETAGSWFANVASAGMSGAIAQRVNESKSRLPKASYFLATFSVFARWQPGELRVSVDGENRTGRMRDVVVANCRYFAAGMKICPEAEPDDGLFDTLLIGDITKTDLALTLPRVYRGTHLPHPKAELLRGRVVTVESDVPVPVELDGEQPGTTPARFEVLPQALRLRVP